MPTINIDKPAAHTYKNFVRSGYMGVNVKYMKAVGQDGWFWSGNALIYTSPIEAKAANLLLNSTTVNSSRTDDRYYGFSLRCLAD